MRERLNSPLRLRRLMIVGGYVAVVVFGASVWADHVYSRGDDWRRFNHHTVHVTKVISGDCVEVKDSLGITLVKMLGVRAPLASDGLAEAADKATATISARAVDRDVILLMDPTQPREADGKLRAYVYLSETDCLEMDLTHDGLVFADREESCGFETQYAMTESEARRKQRGMWKTMSDEAMPAWRKMWLKSYWESRRATTKSSD